MVMSLLTVTGKRRPGISKIVRLPSGNFEISGGSQSYSAVKWVRNLIKMKHNIKDASSFE